MRGSEDVREKMVQARGVYNSLSKKKKNNEKSALNVDFVNTLLRS